MTLKAICMHITTSMCGLDNPQVSVQLLHQMFCQDEYTVSEKVIGSYDQDKEICKCVVNITMGEMNSFV